jgi:3-dehydroquinate synthetase
MVDAAVGGKTGMNTTEGKNLVGAFHEPFTVLGDLDFLETLPPSELRSGLAEVLKCGFIADPAILDEFEADPLGALEPGNPVQARLIRRAVAVKAAVVSADLRERTSRGSDIGREALNYGHTLGHAIERREHFQWRHGEAVAVGMVFAAELAHRLGLIDTDLVARHRSVLERVGLPTSYRAGAWLELRQAMSLDKKTRGSALRFVLLEGLARPAIHVCPGEGVLADAFLGMNER